MINSTLRTSTLLHHKKSGRQGDQLSSGSSVYTACTSMSERDGEDQEEDSPIQACSCWFARHSWLATSGANLSPGQVFSLADVMLPFSGVSFFLCLVFLFFFRCFHWTRRSSLNRSTIGPRPDSHMQFVKTSECSLFCVSFFLEMSLFRVFVLCTIIVFSFLYWRVPWTFFSFPDGVFFLPCDHGLDFDISLCENSIQQIQFNSILTLTSKYSHIYEIIIYCILCIVYIIYIWMKLYRSKHSTINNY